MATQRKCKHCGYEGPDTDFAHTRLKRGLSPYNVCVKCSRAKARERQRQYRKENLDEVRRKDAIEKWHKYQHDADYREKRKTEAKARYRGIDTRIMELLAEHKKRGEVVTHVTMHPTAFHAWRRTEIPSGDRNELEWAGVKFTKDSSLRGGKMVVKKSAKAA